jgi:hypothetical protein
MLTAPTLDKLQHLKLDAMAHAWTEQQQHAPLSSLRRLTTPSVAALRSRSADRRAHDAAISLPTMSEMRIDTVIWPGSRCRTLDASPSISWATPSDQNTRRAPRTLQRSTAFEKGHRLHQDGDPARVAAWEPSAVGGVVSRLRLCSRRRPGYLLICWSLARRLRGVPQRSFDLGCRDRVFRGGRSR